MPVQVLKGDKLDAQARDDLADEERLHGANLRGIIAGDTSGFLDEFQRHMDRVDEIMRAMVGRRSHGLRRLFHFRTHETPPAHPRP